MVPVIVEGTLIYFDSGNRDNGAAGYCGGHAGLPEMCAILSSAIQERDANGNWRRHVAPVGTSEILESIMSGQDCQGYLWRTRWLTRDFEILGCGELGEGC